ncbi:MAG TPA: phosphate acetyltransferase [Cytophagales bacterium]|jgi:phosphate acetyltransferase|nr:phosphate acetyltransferase [Cytophagales bacterium]
MSLMHDIRSRAKQYQNKIILPESLEERTLKAADYLLQEDISNIILLGNQDEILKQAEAWGLKHVEKAEIYDPQKLGKEQEYIDLMVSLRGKKGVTPEIAKEQLQNPLYLSTIMIKNGDADGEVAGAQNATGDVLRPAFQYVKTIPGISVVSGAFVMILPETYQGEHRILVFADCAVHPDPDAAQLAEIAIATARTARAIAGIEPKVAMLSFSTRGSAKHEHVEKVAEATKIAKINAPQLAIDGELQADAALVPAIGSSKAPDSSIAGHANVLVFPSLEAGNIGYKLVQRLAGAEAIGPVLQGMAAPINDLSRGCSMEDIINMVAITSNQAQLNKEMTS